MRPHNPAFLPFKFDYSKITKTLASAQYSLGRLDGKQGNLHLNADLLIAPLSAKEATVSSKIEGTQSTVKDVFLHEAGEKTKYSDVLEVANYRKAIYYSVEKLKQKPLTINIIKDIHSILLEGSRGHSRKGEFRIDQVWLGTEGDPIEKATYIPPIPQKVPEYMFNLEKYVNNDDEDTLIQTALIHYQFEAVHPFNDGNGRIGRLLLPLFLYNRRKLNKPILYLSGYFEANKDEYLDALHQVDTKGNYEYWINYFLTAVQIQAEQTEKLIDNITSLYIDLKKRTDDIKSPYIGKLVEFLFKRPIFSAPQATKELKAYRGTTIRLINELLKRKIILSIKIKDKKPIYGFPELINRL